VWETAHQCDHSRRSSCLFGIGERAGGIRPLRTCRSQSPGASGQRTPVARSTFGRVGPIFVLGAPSQLS
jgi:hypothetical protein